MKKSDTIQVVDEGDLRKYRTEIPNLIDDLDLSVYAFRLYVHLKRVAGDRGECFQGTRRLAQQCHMALGMVGKAKRELVEAGLIRLEPGDKKAGTTDRITIVNIWSRNFSTFDRSQSEQGVHYMNTPVHDMNTPDHQVNTPVHHMNKRSNPIKKEPTKKEPVKNDAPAAHTPTAQQEMFGAVCEVLGWDYSVLDRNSKGQVAQTVGILKDSGYTVDDLRRFMTDIWFNDWRWEKKQQRPTPKQLREEIGKLRVTVPPEHLPKTKNRGAAAVDAYFDRVASVIDIDLEEINS